jgi:MoaA/NifB/PqqE/SkfB family radical SAM enzyme
LVEEMIPKNIIKALASDFQELGAIKLTLMGGEPTLYPKNSLFEIIKYLKLELGYKYVRIDTNGMFPPTILRERNFQLLDEITFSIDCSRQEINDKVRIGGNLNKIMRNIMTALKLGYKVQVTSTVHKYNQAYIEELVRYLEKIGVQYVNFHPIFKMGVPRDVWIPEDIYITPRDWLSLYERINKKIQRKKYGITVRIPERLIQKDKFESNREYYGYCPEKLFERILVHPDGILRICALMIGTPYGIAWFNGRIRKIVWNNTSTNELRDNDLNNYTPCPKQRALYLDNYYPLCISFKPEQKEIVYEELKWESRRKKRPSHNR